jgi:hypothetical protein
MQEAASLARGIDDDDDDGGKDGIDKIGEFVDRGYA